MWKTGISENGLKRIKNSGFSKLCTTFLKRDHSKDSATIYFESLEDAKTVGKELEENGISVTYSYSSAYGIPTLVFSNSVTDEEIMPVLEGLSEIAVPLRDLMKISTRHTAFSPNMSEIEDWWEYIDPAEQKHVFKSTGITPKALVSFNASDWEKLINFYAQTIEGGEQGWQRGRNV